MRVAAITWSNQARSGSLPAIASGSSMFSSALSIGSRLKNWKTKPMWSRRSSVSSVSSSLVMSMPSSSTVPSVGRSRPASRWTSVDLPEPDGPITAVSCPLRISTSTSRRASTAVSPWPKRRVTPRATSTGVESVTPSRLPQTALWAVSQR